MIWQFFGKTQKSFWISNLLRVQTGFFHEVLTKLKLLTQDDFATIRTNNLLF